MDPNFTIFLQNRVTIPVRAAVILCHDTYLYDHRNDLHGVIHSLVQKRKIQCACLGAVFQLPMSTITIIEDALMIAISAYNIAVMIF